MENEPMSQDDVLFLEVLSDSLKNEMESILKLIELYRSQSLVDQYYFDKKFLLSTLINNAKTANNCQILNEMKFRLVKSVQILFYLSLKLNSINI
jgi:hypothetical protein